MTEPPKTLPITEAEHVALLEMSSADRPVPTTFGARGAALILPYDGSLLWALEKLLEMRGVTAPDES